MAVTSHWKGMKFRGFTLLEIMIVLALMGLFATTVFVSMDSQDADKQVQQQARRFQVVVNMLSDQAVLTQA